MKRDNLDRMAAHIETIDPSLFNIIDWRLGRTKEEMTSIECNSVACVIGHCVQLDPHPDLVPRSSFNKEIDFFLWSESFTGLDGRSDEWKFLFAPEWVETDNTPAGAARRIRHFLTHGLPDDWQEQMEGFADISY